MTLANLQKQHARLKFLISGEFTERDFDYTLEANANPHGKKGESGRMTMGDFNNEGSKRKDLIIFKAKKTLLLFEEKYPEFKDKVKVTPAPKKVEETKSVEPTPDDPNSKETKSVSPTDKTTDKSKEKK